MTMTYMPSTSPPSHDCTEQSIEIDDTSLTCSMLSKMQLVTMLIKLVSHVIAKYVTSKNVNVDAVSPTVHSNYLQFVSL